MFRVFGTRWTYHISNKHFKFLARDIYKPTRKPSKMLRWVSLRHQMPDQDSILVYMCFSRQLCCCMFELLRLYSGFCKLIPNMWQFEQIGIWTHLCEKNNTDSQHIDIGDYSCCSFHQCEWGWVEITYLFDWIRSPNRTVPTAIPVLQLAQRLGEKYLPTIDLSRSVG